MDDHFNPNSGVFTAPQNGVYLFALDGYANAYSIIELKVNDKIFKGFAEGRSEGINGFTTVFLREGDEVTLHNNLEQSVMGLEDALFTYFGMLLF